MNPPLQSLVGESYTINAATAVNDIKLDIKAIEERRETHTNDISLLEQNNLCCLQDIFFACEHISRYKEMNLQHIPPMFLKAEPLLTNLSIYTSANYKTRLPSYHFPDLFCFLCEKVN